MLTNLLVREEFMQWLKSNPIDEIAGIPNEPSRCVLHKFLEPKLPEDIYKFWLGTHDISIAGENNELLPSWATQFTFKACDASIDGGAYGTVTFGQCLSIMEQLPYTYYLHELSESAEKKAHDDYIITVGLDDWADNVYDYFKDTVGDVIWDCQPDFRLSYSQGDGASFTGEIMALKFIEEYCVKEEYPLLIHTLTNESQDFWSEECEIERVNQQYPHEKSIKVQSLQWQSDYVEGLQEEIESLQERMQQWVENESNKLFELLRTEYEEITSRNHFADYCMENNIEFTIDGERI